MSAPSPSELTVAQLKAELAQRGLSTAGHKAILVKRLEEAYNDKKTENKAEEKEEKKEGKRSKGAEGEARPPASPPPSGPPLLFRFTPTSFILLRLLLKT